MNNKLLNDVLFAVALAVLGVLVDSMKNNEHKRGA